MREKRENFMTNLMLKYKLKMFYSSTSSYAKLNSSEKEIIIIKHSFLKRFSVYQEYINSGYNSVISAFMKKCQRRKINDLNSTTRVGPRIF